MDNQKVIKSDNELTVVGLGFEKNPVKKGNV